MRCDASSRLRIARNRFFQPTSNCFLNMQQRTKITHFTVNNVNMIFQEGQINFKRSNLDPRLVVTLPTSRIFAAVSGEDHKSKMGTCSGHNSNANWQENVPTHFFSTGKVKTFCWFDRTLSLNSHLNHLYCWHCEFVPQAMQPSGNSCCKASLQSTHQRRYREVRTHDYCRHGRCSNPIDHVANMAAANLIINLIFETQFFWKKEEFYSAISSRLMNNSRHWLIIQTTGTLGWKWLER